MARLAVGSENNFPIELYYEVHGTGRPVVLIHGWPLSGRSWERQIPALVDAGYQVITYDRRGFGWSSQPWTGYDYDTLAADLNTLMEQLELRDATLVGFSMGGGEVVRYLSTYGDSRVRQAVLASAVTPNLFKSEDNPEGALDDAFINGFQSQIHTDRLAFLDTFLVNFFAAGERTDLISEPARKYCRDIAAFASAKGTSECVSAWGRTDFRGDLENITVPTLIIHGDSDAIVPFEVSGKRAHEAIDGSQLTLIAGAPHGFNVTHATQFNEALLEFISH
ncbi:MAG: alpha/beta hydrolase [Longispora sp.]|nr:alpha/beta hydrolase [Longispora sp. (in: high G+C Gram-positive bacteria)]